ncbi:hypothetical protein mRhiFer1_009872 [Rhinolophus ferrumequinum]|uniref:Uncharacterized protein n=1 Tax=Rhinolophus ferrumequinum TaxID=59479 RepID=A0A7J7YSG1_RHIFE|nr:hypothetical protein mRhiFer1_009872 [Rhinolophus ferrumequinum]
MHTKSAPFLSRADWTPCWVRQPPPKPGAHDGFLSEGPVRPRLPLLLVPTSWDTSTWSPPCPAFSWLGGPQSSTSPSAPGRIVGGFQPLVSWLPHLPYARGPFPLSQEGLPAAIPAGGVLLLLLVGSLARQGNCPTHVGFLPRTNHVRTRPWRGELLAEARE